MEKLNYIMIILITLWIIIFVIKIRLGKKRKLLKKKLLDNLPVGYFERIIKPNYKDKVKINYDNYHNILYLFFGEPQDGYEDEISPGIFIRRSDKDGKIIGAIIPLDIFKRSEQNEG